MEKSRDRGDIMDVAVLSGRREEKWRNICHGIEVLRVGWEPGAL